MDENKSIAVEFIKQILITFAVAVIAVSVVGWLEGDAAKGAEGLLSLGSGLSYPSLMQIFIFSIIQAILRVLFHSNLIIKKMLLLWRTVLVLLLSFISAILLSVLFRWFPIGSWEAWISFIVSIIVCFIVCVFFMIIKIKLEDKKYRKLLSDYRSKHKKESGE